MQHQAFDLPPVVESHVNSTSFYSFSGAQGNETPSESSKISKHELTPTENGIVNQPGVEPAIQQVAGPDAPAKPARPCLKSIFHEQSSVFRSFLGESIIFHGKTLRSDWHRFRDDVGMTNASVA